MRPSPLLFAFLFAACSGGDPGEPVDTTPPPPSHVELCGAITQDTTWTAAESPYRVTCDLQIAQATLTIEAGVSVEVENNDQIAVGPGGALQIDGSADAPVRLDAAYGSGPGVWGGIYVDPDGALQAEGLEILSAGGRELDGAIHAEGAEIALRGVRIEDSDGCGVALWDGAGFSADSGALEVLTSTGWPICVGADRAHTLPADVSFTDNDEDAVYVIEGQLIEPVSWPAIGAPWHLYGDIWIAGGALTLPAGAELAFVSGSGLLLEGGALDAAGSAEAPVTLRGLNAGPGSWEGVHGADAEVSLSHATLRDAGQLGAPSSLSLTGGVVTAQSLVIQGGEGDGFLLADGATFGPGSADLAVLGCAGDAGELEAPAAGGVPADAIFSGNGEDALYVRTGPGVVTDAAWAGLRWMVRGDLVVAGALSLEPGAELAFGDGAGIYVSPTGALLASGTPDAPVRFTSMSAEVQGAWSGIAVQSGSASLDGVEITWAGGDPLLGALHLQGSSAAALDNAQIAGSGCWGVHLEDGASELTLGDVDFADNACGDVGP